MPPLRLSPVVDSLLAAYPTAIAIDVWERQLYTFWGFPTMYRVYVKFYAADVEYFCYFDSVKDAVEWFEAERLLLQVDNLSVLLED